MSKAKMVDVAFKVDYKYSLDGKEYQATKEKPNAKLPEKIALKLQRKNICEIKKAK